MFKELGTLIEAAGVFAADALKISANTVKEILSEKDDTSEPMCGEVGPAPKDIDPCMFSNLESSDSDSIIVSSDANEEF